MLNTNAVNDNATGTITAFSHNTIMVYVTYSNWLSQKGCAWGDQNSQTHLLHHHIVWFSLTGYLNFFSESPPTLTNLICYITEKSNTHYCITISWVSLSMMLYISSILCSRNKFKQTAREWKKIHGVFICEQYTLWKIHEQLVSFPWSIMVAIFVLWHFHTQGQYTIMRLRDKWIFCG